MKYLILLLLILPITTKAQNFGYVTCGHFPAKCLVISNMGFQQAVDSLQNDPLWCGDILRYERAWTLFSFVSVLESEGSRPKYLMVFTEQLEDNIEGYCVIGHEVLHLMQVIAERFSVDMSKEKESMSYLFEYLTFKTYKIIHK